MYFLLLTFFGKDPHSRKNIRENPKISLYNFHKIFFSINTRRRNLLIYMYIVHFYIRRCNIIRGQEENAECNCVASDPTEKGREAIDLSTGSYILLVLLGLVKGAT